MDDHTMSRADYMRLLAERNEFAARADRLSARLKEAVEGLEPFAALADYINSGEVSGIGPSDVFGLWFEGDDSQPVFCYDKFTVEKFVALRDLLTRLEEDKP